MSEKQKLDLDAELVKALHDEPEAAQATPEGKAEAEQPEAAADESNPEAEAPANEGQPEAEGSEAAGLADDVEIKDLLDEGGKLDLNKIKNLKKSHAHAQKLVGQTAKDRENLKYLAEYQKKAGLLDTFEQLTSLNPNILEEVKRAQMAQRGAPMQPQAQHPNKEETRKKIAEKMRGGEYEEAFNAWLNDNPEVQEFRRTKAELAEFKRQQQEEAQKKSWREEREKWQGDNRDIFNEKGDVVDQELYDYIQNNTLGRTASYKDATTLARAELGRLPAQKPKTNAAKTQAATIPQGRSPAPRKPAVDDTDEIMPGLTSASLLGELKKMPGARK